MAPVEQAMILFWVMGLLTGTGIGTLVMDKLNHPTR